MMRRFFVTAVISLAACTTTATDMTRGPELPTDRNSGATVAESVNLFTADFLTALARSEDGNIFVSPLSLSTAMGMLQAAAKGETEVQINRVFRYPDVGLHRELGALRETVSRQVLPDPRMGEDGGDPQIVSVANSVWVDRAFPLKDGYVGLLTNGYQAPPNPVDFQNNPDAARETINDWVEDRTADRIQDLLTPSDVKPETAFILVNAIYMMAHWQDVFNERDTKDVPFNIDGGAKADRPLMHRTDNLQRLDLPGGEALRIPYANDMSMIVMLPNSARGLEPVNAMMQPDVIAMTLREIDEAPLVRTELGLPKFTLKARYKLNPTLNALGLSDLFTRPDLSGASDDPRMAVGPVIQQVFLDVNEKGTEAAAATAITIVLTGGIANPKKPKPFIVNRPFVILIRDDISGAILFAGRITNPKPSEN